MAFTPNRVHSPCLDEILDRAPLLVSPNTSLAQAIAQMRPRSQDRYPLSQWVERVTHGSALPHPDSYALVVEAEKLVGIFTGRDLHRLETLGCEPSQVSVAEVMTSPAIALREEDYRDIFTVASVMGDRQIHHLPVVDRRGRPVGVITPQSLRPPDPIAAYQTIHELRGEVDRLETENQQLSRHLKTQNLPRTPEADLSENQLFLAEIALHIRDSLDLDRILDTTVKEVRQFLGVDRVTIYRFNAPGSVVGVAESVSPGQESFLGREVRDDCFAENWVEPYKNGKIRTVNDIYTAGMQPCHVELLERLGVRAKVLVPICLPGEAGVGEEAGVGSRESGVGEVDTAGGTRESPPQDNAQLWGLLSATVADEPRRWRESEIDRLKRLAGQIAIAIQQAEVLHRFQTELEEKQKTEAEFKHINAELERRVLSRTAQLQATNRELHREIRDRQTLESRLRSSEAQMRGIFAAMTDIVLVLSAQGKPLEVVATNPALVYHPKWDILSETLKQFSRDQTARQFRRPIAEALDTQKTVDFEYKLARGNAEAWFLARISPISEEAAIWVARDITDRKRSEVRLKNAREELERLVAERTAALEEANNILIAEIQERQQTETILRNIAAGVSAKTGADFFQSLVRCLTQVLGLEYALIGELVRPPANRISVLAVAGNISELRSDEYDLTDTPWDGFAGRAERTARIYSDDVRQKFPRDPLLREVVAKSYLGIPLCDPSGEAVGLMAVWGSRPLEKTNLAEEILNIFAVRATAEIDRLHKSKALRDSEERLRNIVKTTSDGLAVIDAAGKIAFVNPVAASWFGASESQLSGTDFALPTRPTAAEIELPGDRRDGRKMTVEMRLTPMIWEGQPSHLASLRDISDRKRTRAALAKRERYLSALVEVQRQLIALRDTSDGTLRERDDLYRPVLEALGRATVASSAFVLENHRDGRGRLLTRQKVRWFASPREDVGGKNGQNVPWEQMGADLLRPLSKGEWAARTASELSPDRRKWFGDLEIGSFLMLPLMFRGEFYGVLGFADRAEDRIWDLLEIELLTSGVTTLALALERRQAEMALRQSEELHRVILSSISDAVFITDRGGDFTFICPDANTIFGYHQHEVWQLGNIRSLLGASLFDEAHLNACGEIPNIEREIVDKQGDRHTILVNVKRVSIGEGTTLYTCRDISDRKQAEEAIKQMNQELETVVEERTAQLRDANDQLLIEIMERQQIEIEIEDRARQQAIVSELGQQALGGLDLDALIGRVAIRLARGLNVGYCKVVERQPDGRILLTLAVAHAGFEEFTFLNREDLGTEPSDCLLSPTPKLHRHDRINGVSVPLQGQNHDLGCLGVYSDRRKVFIEDDINFIQSVAHVLATAIERKGAEESLQQSEAKFRLFVEHAPAAVAMFDRQMRYLAVSRRWSSDYGLGDRDPIGRSHYEIFPDLSPRWREIHRRCLRGAIETCDEDRFDRADGTTEWLKWEIRPWHDGGGNIGGIIMFTEAITDRKKARAEIRIRARQQAIVAQLGQMALSGTDLETLIREAVIQVPRGLQVDYCKILEFTSARHPRLTLSIWSDEDTYTLITHEPIPPRAVRRPPPLEPKIYRHPTLCGQSIAIQGKTTCFGVLAAYSHDKRDFSQDDLNFLKSVAHILATAIDRQQGEEELQESQQLLQLVMDNIPQSIFWKDRNSVYLGCNRNFARMAGLDDPEQILGLSDTDLPWPDGEANWYRSCDARVMESDRPELHRVETQLQADGQPSWIDTNKIPLHDRAGNVVGILGTYEDITDRKRAEDRLKASLNEKELLLKEIHHRVKNNLLVVSNLLEFQTDYTDDPALIQLLEDSQNRIYSMALIHEKLYRSTGLDRVNFKEYLQALVDSLLESYSSQRGRIEVELDLQAIDLNIETANPCGLIVNELISNALKHAFPDGRRGKIELQLYRDEGRAIVLAVRDDGIGFPKDLDFRHVDSLGLELVCMLTEQLQGEITLDRDRGTRLEISFVELKYKKRF